MFIMYINHEMNSSIESNCFVKDINSQNSIPTFHIKFQEFSTKFNVYIYLNISLMGTNVDFIRHTF